MHGVVGWEDGSMPTRGQRLQFNTHTHLMQSMWRLSGKHAARGPKGPKIEKIKTSPPGLKLSSGNEIFKRAAHRCFVENSQGRDWNFWLRLKFSNEIENFKRDWSSSLSSCHRHRGLCHCHHPPPHHHHHRRHNHHHRRRRHHHSHHQIIRHKHIY